MGIKHLETSAKSPIFKKYGEYGGEKIPKNTMKKVDTVDMKRLLDFLNTIATHEKYVERVVIYIHMMEQ